MKKIMILVGVAFTVLATSCKRDGFCERGNDAEKSETRTVELFSKIESEGAFDIFITQNKDLQEGIVVVEAPADLLEYIKTDVKGDVLHVRNKRCFKGNNDIKVYVKTNEMNNISLSGSGNIQSMNVLETEKMQINVTGSGNIETDLDAEELTVKISGSGNIDTYGEVDSQTLKITGSGNISHYGLDCKDAKVKIEGSGDVYVYASEDLDVNISGSGNVYYKGFPSVSTDISGSGDVKSED